MIRRVSPASILGGLRGRRDASGPPPGAAVRGFDVDGADLAAEVAAAAAELVGRAVAEPEPALLRALVDELRAGRPAQAQLRMLSLEDGAAAWVELRAAAPVQHGQARRSEVALFDVTAHKRVEEEHAAAARAADLVADTARFILYTNEYLPDRTHRAVYRSRDFSHLLGGRPPGQDDETAWDAAVHPQDRPDLLAFRAAVYAGEPTAVEFRVRQLDGSWRWVEARVNPRTDEAGRRLGDGVLLDVDDRKAAELARAEALDEVDRRSRIDVLTGLFNRGHGTEVLEAELERRSTDARAVGAMLLDVDDFKAINDEYGHAVGDAVLQEIAFRIAGSVRSFDCAARWGGEEFCIVLPSAGADRDLERMGETLRAVIADVPVPTPVGPLAVTVSIGAASTAAGLETADALVDAADQALYSAKRRGRNQVRVFSVLSQRDRAEAAPRFVRLAEVLALTASLREGMPLLHCRQVAELAAGVAGAMNLPRHLAVRCQVAGWLHDVGKVAIPDQILRKPGPLDETELEVMRAHPVIGFELTRQVGELAHAAAGVRHHHERWDGRGYPDGLAGGAIPIEARIVAAADAYSGMTMERVYCRPLEHEEAIAELRRSAGSHLDPDVVAALVEVLLRARPSAEQAA